MSKLPELTGKQAKAIIQHILHHIDDYITDSTISLTNRDRASEYTTVLLVNFSQTKATSVQTDFAYLYIKLQVLYLSVHQTFLLKIIFLYIKPL